MDQAELGYDDFIDKTPRGNGKRKTLFLVLILTLIILLLGIGGYVVWSRPDLLPFLAQFRAAPALEGDVTPTLEEPVGTEVAGFSVTSQPEATTTLAPTEPPAEAVAESILPAPEFGRLVMVRPNAEASREEQAAKQAVDMAIREPYQWEYFEFDSDTLVKDVERYYIGLLNKDMGFLMTFNERYPRNAMAIFKFKQEGRRVTIQYYESQKDRTPAAYIFYEGW